MDYNIKTKEFTYTLGERLTAVALVVYLTTILLSTVPGINPVVFKIMVGITGLVVFALFCVVVVQALEIAIRGKSKYF